MNCYVERLHQHAYNPKHAYNSSDVVLTNVINHNGNNLAGRVAPQWEDTLGKKIGRIVTTAFCWVACFALAVVAIGTIAPAAYVGYKLYKSHAALNGTIQEIACKQYTAVKAAVETIKWSKTAEAEADDLCDLDKSPDQDKAEIKEFRKKFWLFRYRITSDPGKDVHAYMQGTRARLNELISHPVYQCNKNRSENAYIAAVHAAVHAFVAESPGMKPMQELGARATKQITEIDPNTELDYAKLNNLLRQVVEKHAVFTKDDKPGKVFWAITHPEKALTSLLDHLGWTVPTEYNSYEFGNASMQLGEFKIANSQGLPGITSHTTFSLSQMPTWTADKLPIADCEAGYRHIYQDLEFEKERHHTHGEAGRVKVKRDMGNDLPTLHYLYTPMDLTDAQKSADTDSNILEEGLKVDGNLATAIRGSIGRTVSGERANKAARLALVALDAIQKMISVAEDAVGETIYINQSCKQNIDRGVVVNVLTMLFADLIAGEDLTEERVHQIVGIVLTRAGMVDDRAILHKRLRPLLDVLDVMQTQPAFTVAIKEHFGQGAIAFNASTE